MFFSLIYFKAYSTYLENLKTNKAEIYLMKDGLAAKDLVSSPTYQSVDINKEIPETGLCKF